MQIGEHKFMRVKGWLFRHHVSSWGEGVVECLFFSLLAFGVWKGTWG